MLADMMEKNLEIREREKPARDKMMTGGIARFAKWLLGGCFQGRAEEGKPLPGIFSSFDHRREHRRCSAP